MNSPLEGARVIATSSLFLTPSAPPICRSTVGSLAYHAMDNITETAMHKACDIQEGLGHIGRHFVVLDMTSGRVATICAHYIVCLAPLHPSFLIPALPPRPDANMLGDRAADFISIMTVLLQFLETNHRLLP